MVKMVSLTREDEDLIKRFENFGKEKCVSGRHSVAAILVSKSGRVYEGTSMEFDCGIGVCAERVAMFKMMPEETEIKVVVAGYKGKIGPPCGVCRELMFEMNKKNLKDTWVILSRNKKVRLGELYPYDWMKAFGR